MLQIEGTFNDKVFDRPTAISPKELATRYGLLLPDANNPIYIRWNDRLQAIKFGQKIHPRSVRLNTKLTATTATGDFFTLNYIHGGPLKSRVILDTPQTTLFSNDIEKAVFMQLHPQCKGSPLRVDDKGPWKYSIYDPAIEQAALHDLQLQMMEMNAAILRDIPWSSLEVLASGFVLNGKNVRSSLKKGELPTRGALVAMLQADPKGFIQAWHLPKTANDGLLFVALERGLIITDHVGNRRVLRFNNNLAGGRTITTLQSGNIYEQLQQAAGLDRSILNILTEALSFTLIPDAKEVAPTGQANEPSVLEKDLEIISEAIGYGLIDYDPDSLTVKKGDAGIATFTLDQLKRTNGDWQQCLAEAFAEDKNTRQSVAMSLRHAKKKSSN